MTGHSIHQAWIAEVVFSLKSQRTWARLTFRPHVSNWQAYRSGFVTAERDGYFLIHGHT
jgi:hypothetical protein